MTDIIKGDEKIQKICDVIRVETLDPANEQAKEIIENAHIQARQIIKKAHNEKEKLINEEKKEIKKEKKIFDSSLNLAIRQALEDLKQKIEKELFSKNLKDVIAKTTKEPQIIASLINAIVTAIEKFGLDVDISAYVPKEVDLKAINTLLLEQVIKKLKEKEIMIGNFDGGVKIKLHEMKITIDISDKALKYLVADYIRADFRKLIYNI